MTTGVIIFSRMGSTRLPGKALCQIGDTTLLGWMLSRARQVIEAERIVIATTELAEDDAIVDFAETNEVNVFRGSSEDVAARALACAERYQLKRFARLCGDSPFFDPTIVDQLITRHIVEDLDIATNVFPRSFPAGTSVEIVAITALRRALTAMSDAADHEHMTQYFYRNPEIFTIQNLLAPDSRYTNIKLAVDTKEDLTRSRWIADRLRGNVLNASLDDIIALSTKWNAVVDQHSDQF